MIQARGLSFPRTIPFASVWIRKTAAVQWMYAPFIEPVSASRRAMPTGSHARLRWRYGELWRPEVGVWGVYDPIDLSGWQVQIRLHGEYGGTPVWTGVVVMGADNVGGSMDGIERGLIEFDAFGFEYLLSKFTVYGSHIDGLGGIYSIDRTIPCNIVDGMGVTPTENKSLTLAFGDYAQWDALSFLTYIIVWFQQDGFTWSWGGDAWALASIIPRLRYEGMTVLDIIQTIIGNSRGLGWCVDYDGYYPYITVFSQIDQTIALPDFILPGNQAQIGVFDTDIPFLNPTVQFSNDTRYDSITVCGEHVKALGTWRLANTELTVPAAYPAEILGHLIPAWDSAVEAAYVATDDAGRTSQQFEDVYTAWALPDDYRWQQVTPACDDYGNVYIDGGENNALWGNGYMPGKRFERYLPLPESNGEAQPLRAVYQDPDTNVYYTLFGRAVPVEEGEESPTVPVSITPLDGKLGVRIKPAGLNHLIAKGLFDADSETEPVMTPQGIDLTMFLATDARPYMRGYLPQNFGTGAGPLVIYLPDCEFWYAAGKPIAYASENGTISYLPVGWIYRDDRAKLAAAYLLAYAIYSRPRRPVTLQYSTLFPGAPIGFMITALVNMRRVREVGTVITECAWDFESGTTQIRTGFAEMDIARLAGGMR